MTALTRASKAKSKLHTQNAAHKHHQSPTAIRLRAQVDLAKELGIYDSKTTRRALFQKNNITPSTGYRMLANKAQSDQTFPYKDLPNTAETRGRKPLVSEAKIKEIEEYLNRYCTEEKALT
jgi:hypothetical protein